MGLSEGICITPSIEISYLLFFLSALFAKEYHIIIEFLVVIYDIDIYFESLANYN